MADPILDEEMLIDALETPVCLEACQQLQQASLYSIVAAHDRGATRQEFTNALDAGLCIYAQMGKIFLLNSMREHCAQGTLDLELIDKAITKSHSYAENAHVTLLAFMKRLIECPTSKDKVH